MFALALTGSIATGKSTALQMFADQNIPTYSADQAVHELYGTSAVEPIAKLFPDAVRDGKVDRNKLSAFLIKRPEMLEKLEAIVHPLVRQKMEQFLSQCAREHAEMAVVEIPLLFETGTSYPVNGVAVTYCSDILLRQRALARPGMSEEKLNTMLARQMPQEEKKKRADFIIDTGTDLLETQAEVEKIIAACRNKPDTDIKPSNQEPVN